MCGISVPGGDSHIKVTGVIIIPFLALLRVSKFKFVGLEMIPVGGKMNLSHTHKTRLWYLLEVLFKISDDHPCHF